MDTSVHRQAVSLAHVDDRGWLHTGDVGHCDTDGDLQVWGRLADRICTLRGVVDAPDRIEADLNASGLVAASCLVGDGQPALAALVTIDPDALQRWAEERGREPLTTAQACRDPQFQEAIAAVIDDVNQRRSDVERIEAFLLLPETWQPDSDVMTPTMKLRRTAIRERFHQQIADIFRTQR